MSVYCYLSRQKKSGVAINTKKMLPKELNVSRSMVEMRWNAPIKRRKCGTMLQKCIRKFVTGITQLMIPSKKS